MVLASGNAHLSVECVNYAAAWTMLITPISLWNLRDFETSNLNFLGKYYLESVIQYLPRGYLLSWNGQLHNHDIGGGIVTVALEKKTKLLLPTSHPTFRTNPASLVPFDLEYTFENFSLLTWQIWVVIVGIVGSFRCKAGLFRFTVWNERMFGNRNMGWINK